MAHDPLMKKLLLYITVALLTVGCSQSTLHPESANRVPTIDPAQAKLSEAADSVSRSLLTLAEVQQAATPPPKSFRTPDPASYGMANLVSVNWSGPIEPLVEQIAKATNYHVRVLGKAPAIPVMVSLSEKNKPLGEILTNAGYQAGKKANIVVFPHSRTIELRYANS